MAIVKAKRATTKIGSIRAITLAVNKLRRCEVILQTVVYDNGTQSFEAYATTRTPKGDPIRVEFASGYSFESALYTLASSFRGGSDRPTALALEAESERLRRAAKG